MLTFSVLHAHLLCPACAFPILYNLQGPDDEETAGLLQTSADGSGSRDASCSDLEAPPSEEEPLSDERSPSLAQTQKTEDQCTPALESRLERQCSDFPASVFNKQHATGAASLAIAPAHKQAVLQQPVEHQEVCSLRQLVLSALSPSKLLDFLQVGLPGEHHCTVEAMAACRDDSGAIYTEQAPAVHCAGRVPTVCLCLSVLTVYACMHCRRAVHQHQGGSWRADHGHGSHSRWADSAQSVIICPTTQFLTCKHKVAGICQELAAAPITHLAGCHLRHNVWLPPLQAQWRWMPTPRCCPSLGSSSR